MATVPSDLALSSDQQQLTFDFKGLCRILHMSSATIHRLKSAAKLPREHKLGAKLLWDAEEIRAWIKAGMPDRKTWEALRNAGNKR